MTPSVINPYFVSLILHANGEEVTTLSLKYCLFRASPCMHANQKIVRYRGDERPFVNFNKYLQ